MYVQISGKSEIIQIFIPFNVPRTIQWKDKKLEIVKNKKNEQGNSGYLLDSITLIIIPNEMMKGKKVKMLVTNYLDPGMIAAFQEKMFVMQ